MKVIYLDVLIILNLYVTFFLIKASCCAIHKKPSNKRIMLGSALGGLSSLIILLPEFGTALTVLIKLITGIIIVFSVFGFGTIKAFLKRTTVFLIVNFLFAGLMLMLWLFSAPLGMVYNNGFAYFDISLLTIIVSTALAYGLLRLTRYFLDSRTDCEKKYTVEITFKDKSVTLDALADSGNGLVDFLTGLPVIICDYSKTSQVAPSEIKQFFLCENSAELYVTGLRILPFSTVSGSGTVIAFKPDMITVRCDSEQQEINALIGFSNLHPQKYEAIFNPKILT